MEPINRSQQHYGCKSYGSACVSHYLFRCGNRYKRMFEFGYDTYFPDRNAYCQHFFFCHNSLQRNKCNVERLYQCIGVFVEHGPDHFFGNCCSECAHELFRDCFNRELFHHFHGSDHGSSDTYCHHHRKPGSLHRQITNAVSSARKLFVFMEHRRHFIGDHHFSHCIYFLFGYGYVGSEHNLFGCRNILGYSGIQPGGYHICNLFYHLCGIRREYADCYRRHSLFVGARGRNNFGHRGEFYECGNCNLYGHRYKQQRVHGCLNAKHQRDEWFSETACRCFQYGIVVLWRSGPDIYRNTQSAYERHRMDRSREYI